MGLFDKIKGIISNGKEKNTDNVSYRQEDKNRFNPDNKSLEWFGSEDGIKAFKEYTSAQSYFLEEKLKKEHESKYSEYDFHIYVSVFHKDEKLPSIYFKSLVDKIDVEALQFVGTMSWLVDILSLQAEPYFIDDEGELQFLEPRFAPEEIVSVEKNPALNFVVNFNCFELNDDDQGSWEDKYFLWSDILTFVGVFCSTDREIISKNPWFFSKEVYLNESGKVKNYKEFYKACMERTTDERYKSIFEEKYNECE